LANNPGTRTGCQTVWQTILAPGRAAKPFGKKSWHPDGLPNRLARNPGAWTDLPDGLASRSGISLRVRAFKQVFVNKKNAFFSNK
jgi:hypothetical protein